MPPREAVERLLTLLAGALSDSVVGRCVPALVEAAEHHPEVAEQVLGGRAAPTPRR